MSLRCQYLSFDLCNFECGDIDLMLPFFCPSCPTSKCTAKIRICACGLSHGREHSAFHRKHRSQFCTDGDLCGLVWTQTGDAKRKVRDDVHSLTRRFRDSRSTTSTGRILCARHVICLLANQTSRQQSLVMT